MKKFFLIATLLLFLTHIAVAQHGSKEERIESMRIAYITEQLDLTPNEASEFWPVYNEFKKKSRDLREGVEGDGETNNMSDSELEAYLNKRFEIEQKELDLKKAYFEKFKTVLAIRKVVRLPQAEKRFKGEVLKAMQRRRQARQQRQRN